jgi:ferrous iron transport protein B
MNISYRIALVGNPNCGKTTLFNALTGLRHRVGNWPGVTVEKKSGIYRYADAVIEVVDLPGIYSLDSERASLDERIAHDYIISGAARLVVNVVDAAQLERNLYLTTQLADTGVPFIIALNMVDVAEEKGQPVDSAVLEKQLGCPVIPIIAVRENGIDTLKAAIHENALHPPKPHSATSENAADDVTAAAARYATAQRIAAAAQKSVGMRSHPLTERIDRIVLNRWLGVPIFLLLMYLMFMFTINLGGAFIDFFDQAAGALFVDGFGELLGAFGAPEWLSVVLAKGIGGGIQTVATFIPVIGFLYLFLSVLEDSGYMARAAFVMDRLMRAIGLPGKSFVPLIVGFGCNVPAIMATRTLERHRDRLMTMAMAPFMSCGARLPVYVLFGAAFFQHNAQNVVFALYLIGILAAIVTGLVLKSSLFKDKATPYVMELPPYLLPTLRGILIHSWGRLKAFIVGAGRIIVPMVLVINLLNSIGTDGSFGNEDSEKSVLAAVGRTISPAFSAMGLNEENWPASVGIFTGILAKEVVVGTLNATYSALATSEAKTEGKESKTKEFDLAEALSAALGTIPRNLSEALDKWTDPLGLNVGDLSDLDSVAKERKVALETIGAMASRFDGAAGAFAYLLFILLYTPCTASLAAIYREGGMRWMLFVAAWTLGLAYGLATVFYQIANFARDPLTATMWITGITFAFLLAISVMRHYGKRQGREKFTLQLNEAFRCNGCQQAGRCRLN